MSRSNASLKLPESEILNDLQSFHPHGDEITLKFSDAHAMEAFKLAAMNILIANQQAPFSAPKTRKKSRLSDGRRDRIQTLENELFGQKPSRRAAILCRTALYWIHLEELLSTVLDEAIDELRARQYVHKLCGINNKRELDYNPAAVERYHKLIENPFLAWLAHH